MQALLIITWGLWGVGSLCSYVLISKTIRKERKGQYIDSYRKIEDPPLLWSNEDRFNTIVISVILSWISFFVTLSFNVLRFLPYSEEDL